MQTETLKKIISDIKTLKTETQKIDAKQNAVGAALSGAIQ